MNLDVDRHRPLEPRHGLPVMNGGCRMRRAGMVVVLSLLLAAGVLLTGCVKGTGGRPGCGS